MIGTSNLAILIFSTCFFHFRHLLPIAHNFMKSRSRDGLAAKNLLVYSPHTCTNFTMLIGWEHVNWSQTEQKVEIESKKLKLSAKSWNWVQKLEIKLIDRKVAKENNTHRWPIKSFVFKSSVHPGWRNSWHNFSACVIRVRSFCSTILKFLHVYY